jgi:trans-AT polyketide synthase, acyltransferase and oxidoreductase domains
MDLRARGDAIGMTTGLPSIGRFTAAAAPAFEAHDLADAARRARETAFVVADDEGRVGVCFAGTIGGDGPLRLLGALPPLYPEWLGDRAFTEAHGVRFPYVVGEMANGIATADMVIAAARHGCLGFFGAAGLQPARIEAALDVIEGALTQGEAWGVNLIHSPHEPDLEDAVVDVYLRRGVRRRSPCPRWRCRSPSRRRRRGSGRRGPR